MWDADEEKKLTHYIVKGEHIICYNNNESIFVTNYSREKEKELLGMLRDNAKDEIYNQKLKIKEQLKEHRKYLYRSLFWITLNTINTINTPLTGFKITFTGLSCAYLVLYLCRIPNIIKCYKQQKEIAKKEYFFENEGLINKNIIEKYKEEHKDQSQEIDITDAPLITINDVYQLSSKELKEMVENIKKTNNNYTLRLN